MNYPFVKAALIGSTTLAVTASVMPAHAFTVFGNETDYLNALDGAGLKELPTETFDSTITAADTITFANGVTSTMTNRGGGNDNRVNNEYFGSLGRDDGRTVTWNFPLADFPSGINAFSFEIQGVTPSKDLSISGLFNGPDGGIQTVSFKADAGITNSSYSFFGLVGDGPFDSFTFFDGVSSGNGNDFNFKVDNFTAAVPTPALLPGLIGMGVAALRKRQKAED